MGEGNDKIIGEAQAEFDPIKADLKSLHDWSQKSIKQEQEDRSNSCENNMESMETLDRTSTTIECKFKDLENTTSKPKRGISADIEEEIRIHRTPPPLRDKLGRGLDCTIPPPLPPPSPLPPKTLITLGQQVAPVPLVKKEPQNLPHPPKFDGTSSKLEEFVQKVDNIFECMPLSYRTTSEKTLYISDLLTGRADVWYRINQHKRLPNEQTKWLEWDSYG